MLKNALKAANHKIEELHAALRAQTALQVAPASPRMHLLEQHHSSLRAVPYTVS